jgi:hypothetical protein
MSSVIRMLDFEQKKENKVTAGESKGWTLYKSP